MCLAVVSVSDEEIGSPTSRPLLEEIAATVSFLVSDGAGYITGQNLRVDGGITRSV